MLPPAFRRLFAGLATLRAPTRLMSGSGLMSSLPHVECLSDLRHVSIGPPKNGSCHKGVSALDADLYATSTRSNTKHSSQCCPSGFGRDTSTCFPRRIRTDRHDVAVRGCHGARGPLLLVQQFLNPVLRRRKKSR